MEQPQTLLEPLLEPSKPKENPLVAQYIASLTEKEYQSYLIAKDHMKSLFNIEKTNGFLAWKKKMNL
jgi:hypothetical protein